MQSMYIKMIILSVKYKQIRKYASLSKVKHQKAPKSNNCVYWSYFLMQGILQSFFYLNGAQCKSVTHKIHMPVLITDSGIYYMPFRHPNIFQVCLTYKSDENGL